MTDPLPSSDRVPQWPDVRDALNLHEPQAVVIDGTPEVELVIDGAAHLISIRCEAPPTVGPDDFELLSELEIRRPAGEPRWLQISIRTEELFPYFLAFASTVADAVQLDKLPVKAAVTQSLRLFRRLTRDTTMLSPKKSLGLLGELWVLDRLVHARQADGLDAWLGPNAEVHDFRIGSHELEVKSTRGQHRHHIINGLDQLVPSPNADLHIVSLQYAAAGPADSGRVTLAGAIRTMRENLAPFGQAEIFSGVLIDRFHLLPEAEERYTEPLKLRSEVRLIPVTDSFPRLTRLDLELLPHDDMDRVLDATYELNCDALGYTDGTAEFLEVIP